MKIKDPSLDYLQSIINLYNQGLLQQSLSESSEMLEKFPNSIVLYNIAGASNLGLMQFDDAIDCYKQMLRIKPDYAEAYYNMGVALKNKGNLEAAIDSYRQAHKIKPDYADAFNNIGNIFKASLCLSLPAETSSPIEFIASLRTILSFLIALNVSC